MDTAVVTPVDQPNIYESRVVSLEPIKASGADEAANGDQSTAGTEPDGSVKTFWDAAQAVRKRRRKSQSELTFGKFKVAAGTTALTEGACEGAALLKGDTGLHAGGATLQDYLNDEPEDEDEFAHRRWRLATILESGPSRFFFISLVMLNGMLIGMYTVWMLIGMYTVWMLIGMYTV